MPTNTTSASNTPQAKDDTYVFTEAELLASGQYNAATNIVVLDVMSNDLGGKAKQLFSIDEGSAGFLNDLMTNNVNTGWETLPSGNRIQIVNGKMQLDISHSLGGQGVESLAAGETITETFVYSIQLGNGTLSWAKVTFTVIGENDATTGSATAVLAAGTEDTAYTLHASDLLTGFTDVDGDTLSVSGLTANHGTLHDNGDGTWTFTPDANFHGTVNLTYNVLDGHGSNLAATQSFTLAAVNDAPMLTGTQATLASGTEDNAYTVSAANLLAGFSDVDGDSLSVSGLTANHGTAVQNGDGSWTITPAANYNGPVSLSYSVVDGHGGSVAATQNFSLAAVNDGPTTTPVTLAAIAEDSGVRVITQAQLLVNASDVDGPSLAATGLAISSGTGTLVDNGDGTWNYTPALNDDTAVSFSYTVTDGSLTAAGSATLDITPVNDAPTTTPVTLAAIAEDSGVRVITQAQLLANASDVDGPSLAAAGLAISSGTGTLVDNGDGTWNYTPALNDDTAVSFSYTVTDGSLTAAGSATLDITRVNDAPTTTPVTLAAIAEDSGVRLITQAELLANASDVDGPSLTATGLAIASGAGTLVDNGDGTWNYTPALNDDTAVSFSYTVTDGSLTAAGSATLDITPVNDGPTTTPVTLVAIAEDSGVRVITQAQLLANASDVDGPLLTATGLTIASGAGTLVDNGDGTWNYTPALNDDTAVSFNYTVTDGSLTAAGSATMDITPVNDGPTTTPVTLAAIAEDSGVRVITQAELLANASDVDGPALTATGLAISTGTGTLVDNGDGTWEYTPALNDDTAVSFSYTVTDGSLTAAGSATLDITPVNDGPTTTPVTLAAIAEDSGVRVITQAELLANASDVDGPSLTATGLAISTGTGTLVDNGDGTWNYTPALNDDAAVSFSYTVTDGSLTAVGSATLDITPVNDAPTTSPVTLAAIAEDSGVRVITQAQLLANASDVDGPSLAAVGLAISSGTGTLADNGDGTWNYTPALNDDTAVSFSYTVTDGSLTAAGSATLDITPVNDAPTTTPVTLAAIAEDSGVRVITQAELLANASDVEGDTLTASNLAIATGSGTLVNNGDGTWNYTSALNDDTAVSFSYVVSDGDLTAAGSATLDITPVNDAPTTTPVTLAAVAEDSGVRVITQAELLANASDVDGPSLTATGLAIASGAGTLVDNGDGTWNYTPALNDDTAVSFSYTVTDGSLTAAGSATLDITPVNDGPTTTPVTLAAIAEDSGVRTITQAELLANASDVDGPSLTATGLAIASGAGTLVDNGNGTWNYTPALNDDTAVSFSYTVTDGSLTAAGSATLDITPVNDGPTTTPVTLTAIAEDSGVRTITQAELLANANDVDGPSLTATGLAILSGIGTLVDNGDGTWNYTPALNDDTAVSFSYTVTDGSLTAAGSATLDITPVNDGPTTTPVTLAAIAEDSGVRVITQAQLLANASDVDGPPLSAVGLAIATGSGTLVDNGNGTWNYTPALNDDTAVSFSYTVTDGSLTAAGSATLDITPVNDAPTTTPVTLAAIAEDSGVRVITQAELLANASDADGPALSATGLTIASGNGTLFDNGNGTWNYTPALNDSSAVSFSYTVTDGSLTAAGSATLDITPVNDAPTTTPVTLAAIAEDSGVRVITQAELLANASDVDGPSLTATGLAISSGAGTLVNNGNGTWNYTPALNDNSAVSFSYTVTDGSLTAAGSATLDITPVNDAPVFTSSATIGTLREHLINTTLNGFNAASVGTVTATDVDGNPLSFAITSDSSGGAFKINALTGAVTVRDVSLLDFEAATGLSTDGSGKFYSLTLQVSDGTTTSVQAAKIYLTDVISESTNGSANYVDGDGDVDSFQMQNGNDVAFGDANSDDLSGGNQNDMVFGGAGSDTLTGNNGNDTLYGGAGVDSLTGGSEADTFVFGDGSFSGVDTVKDYNTSEGDKLFLVNDQAALFATLATGALAGTAFASGAGMTSAGTADVRIVYDTTTGNLFYDADGNGGAASAIQFATVFSGGNNHPTLTAADFLVGPPPGP